MNKMIEWMRESNRWKHLVGGFAVGVCGLSAWGALYAAIVAASCLELKDRLYGNEWDWTDWVLTLAGGAIGAAFWLMI